MGDRSEAGWRPVEEKNKGEGKVRSRSKFKVLEIRQPYVVQRAKQKRKEERRKEMHTKGKRERGTSLTPGRDPGWMETNMWRTASFTASTSPYGNYGQSACVGSTIQEGMIIDDCEGNSSNDTRHKA